MIVPDLNLLIYAYNSDAPLHADAKTWWENLMNGNEQVAVPWVVSCGFVRLMTNPRVLQIPLPPKIAMDHVSVWFSLPHVSPISPGSQHLAILGRLLEEAGVGANLVTDAHIAAIAVEYQAEVHSNDTDFSRFSGLNWRNPLLSS